MTSLNIICVLFLKDTINFIISFTIADVIGCNLVYNKSDIATSTIYHIKKLWTKLWNLLSHFCSKYHCQQDTSSEVKEILIKEKPYIFY